TALERGRLTILDDTYNANPASLAWAVRFAHWLAGRRGRPLGVVVGSMLELGDESDRLHAAAAREIAALAPALIGAGGAFVPAFAPLSGTLGPRLVTASDAAALGPKLAAGHRGRPTTCGRIILRATVAPTLLWARRVTRYAVVAVAAMLWMGMIGFLDDYLKIVRSKSQGLVARCKLIGQISFGRALGLFLLSSPLAPNLPPTSTQLPVFKYQLIVFWPATYVLF